MKERWIENQSFDLLNIQYFHVVFTVPAELNPLFLSNQEKLYRLFFSCAAETLTHLAWDKKYLGAQIGCIEVLHTWGQRLDFHPHIHCIVPGGGLNKIGQWVSSRKKFFIPVKVLSRMFRGKFLAALKTMDLDFSELFGEDFGITTAVENAVVNESSKNNGVVYNLSGQAVRENNASLEGLSKGVYVVNGKKIVVR